MSPSNTAVAAQLSGAIQALREAADRALTNDQICEISENERRDLLASAIKLYAAIAERSGSEDLPRDMNVSTTEAIVLACALLRSQDLTPFDLALWFNRNAHGSDKY